MAARIERVPVPEPAQLRRALADRADSVFAGATVVDEDVQGHTGVDLLLADEEGRPIFVDIMPGDAGSLPTRVFEHREWFQQNRRLLLKAYSEAGVVRIEDPIFVFVAPRFRGAVMSAVGAMTDVPVRLVRVEQFVIDGVSELLLEDITPAPLDARSTGLSPALRKTDEATGRSPAGGGADHVGQGSDPRDVIETEVVRSLLSLFRSGVDGLDGRMQTSQSEDGFSFNVGDRRLARVAVSPASFTVSPGDGLANPIVVSDRVSLERALNAVVSFYVREERPADGGNGSGAANLSNEERDALSEIWSTVTVGEGS